MAITAADIIYRLSGGATNTNPNASLGGVKSSTVASASVFDGVSTTESVAGDVEYRCIYVHNNHATLTLQGTVAWLAVNTPSTATVADIAVGSSVAGGTEQTVANEDTAPTGLTFVTAADAAGSVALGDIPAGSHRAIWLRRTVTAGAGAFADGFTVRVRGTSAAAPVGPPPTPTVVGMVVTSDDADNIISLGSTFTIVATLTMSDGTSQPVSAYRITYNRSILSAPVDSRTFTTIAPGYTTIQNDNSGVSGYLVVTVRNADGTLPTPVAPPPPNPTDPVDPTLPPPTPPPPFNFPPEPAVPSPVTGPHLVAATVVDGAGIVWYAQAYVGDDATTPFKLVNLKNSAGADHYGLQAWFYADCCHVAIGRYDAAYTETNCHLRVTYDGQPAAVPLSSYPDGTVTFWRGCWMPAIRYGTQVPYTANPVDWSVLPEYSKEIPFFISDVGRDFTFNGVGASSYTRMGTAGERPDIGFLPSWYLPFVLNPNQAAWDVVRRSEDWSGVWNTVYYSHPVTGRILKTTDYPNVTTLPQSSGTFPGNPIVRYLGRRNGDTVLPMYNAGWNMSDCPFLADSHHLTGYGMLAGMITRAAHDLDNASYWAGWTQMSENPAYNRSWGIVESAGATRHFAWCLRSIFVASFYSSDTAYFTSEVQRNIAIANSYKDKNPFGIIETGVTYKGTGSATGYWGVPLWMQSYLAMVYGAVATKFPEAIPYAQFLGKLEVTWFSKPYALVRTVYSFIIQDADHKTLTDFDEMVRLSLVSNGYTEGEAAAMVAATTVQEAYDVNSAYWARLYTENPKNGHWTGLYANGVSDFRSGASDPESYPAGCIASINSAANVGTPGIEQAVAYIDNLPTKINYLYDEKYHIVRRPPSV